MRGDIRPRSQENEGPTEGIQYLVQRFFNKWCINTFRSNKFLKSNEYLQCIITC
jgi:hypothetical protein